MDASTTREWHPGSRAVVFMNIAGLVLFAVGLAAYASAWSGGRGSGSFAFSGSELLLGIAMTLVLSFALMVVHEGVHALAIWGFGGAPRFGATMIGKVIPALYCTAPGKQFTKAQYLVVALAPLVALGGACAVAVAYVPLGGWLVLPAAIHLSGCVGDIALAWVAARQPQGTRIEDLKSGMRFST